MQLKPMEKSDEYRCWLSLFEQDRLKTYYVDNLERQVAIRLILHGLRSDEVTRVSRAHICRLNADEETQASHPRWETGYRECPISNELRTTIVTLSSAQRTRGGRVDASACDVITRVFS